MFKFIFSIVIILLSGFQLRAQALDSLKVYELQPVEFSQKIGNDYWTVQNYFSKKRKSMFQPLRVGYLVYKDTSSVHPPTCGVAINIPKERNKIIIKQLIYPSFYADTLQFRDIRYMLLIQHRDGTYTSKHLSIENSATRPYKESDFISSLQLNTVNFKLEAITLQDGDSAYMMRVLNRKFQSHSTIPIYSNSIKGKHTYKYANNQLTIIENDINVFAPNQVWQTRITFRSYKE